MLAPVRAAGAAAAGPVEGKKAQDEALLGESATAFSGDTSCPVPPCSTEGGAPTVATFETSSEEPLQLCWLDSAGAALPVATLLHDQSEGFACMRGFAR